MFISAIKHRFVGSKTPTVVAAKYFTEIILEKVVEFFVDTPSLLLLHVSLHVSITPEKSSSCSQKHP